MRTDSMTIRAALLGACVLLAACNRGERTPEVEPEPTATPPAQASILRDDLEDTAPPEALLAPLNERVLIDDTAEDLSEAVAAQLMSIAGSPQVERGGRVTLRAHSDSAGSDAANLKASQTRGELVRDFLIENGVPEDQITLIAFGEQNPVEPNALPDGTANEAGRAANRRVDIHVAVGRQTEPQDVTASDEEETDRRTLAEDAAEIIER